MLAPVKSKLGITALSRDAQTSSMNWLIFGFMLLFHLGAIAALFFFTWSALVVAVILHVVAINVGIGMGYHRLLTHRGYQVPRWMEYLLAVCATLSLEGGPLVWVATHRLHHHHTDQAETRILLEKAGGGPMRGGLSMEQARTLNLCCSPSMLPI